MSNSISGEEGLKFSTLVARGNYDFLFKMWHTAERRKEEERAKRLFHVCSRTCSQCSIEGGNLRAYQMVGAYWNASSRNIPDCL